ncbi:hypothetical protein [Roseomonas chloroacetimidivorans]|uniref:hypothetical protein n=1 Tax=Roseomonas chloroacetimidivorans TaxID=1766656 RepID=UPI003C710271
MFAITNARAYREKTEADLARFLQQSGDSGLAVNAVTSAYHLHEWLWAHELKKCNPAILRGTLIGSIDDFKKWLDANCPYFKLVQDLTNGSKHAAPVFKGKTKMVDGYDEGPIDVGPWDEPYLLIDLGAGGNSLYGGTKQYLLASEVIRQAGEFMIAVAKEVGA